MGAISEYRDDTINKSRNMYEESEIFIPFLSIRRDFALIFLELTATRKKLQRKLTTTLYNFDLISFNI